MTQDPDSLQLGTRAGARLASQGRPPSQILALPRVGVVLLGTQSCKGHMFLIYMYIYTHIYKKTKEKKKKLLQAGWPRAMAHGNTVAGQCLVPGTGVRGMRLP
jgi:hypothetical protein